MFKKIFLLLFTLFMTINSYSDNGMITVQERCQIAKQNLELLNNQNKQVFIREDGKLRTLTYRKILAQREENKEIIHKFCNKTVEEKTSDSAKYETRAYGEPSTITALRNAIMSRNLSEALTLLDTANFDYSLENKIRRHLEKDDYTAALNELNEEHSDERWGKVRRPFNSRNECEQERRRLNRTRPDLPTLHCEKLGVVWVLLP